MSTSVMKTSHSQEYSLFYFLTAKSAIFLNIPYNKNLGFNVEYSIYILNFGFVTT